MKERRAGAWMMARDSLAAVAKGLVVLAALTLVAASIAAAAGLIPWPQVALFFGGQALPMAGMWLQLGLTALLVMLLFYLPANLRMARLERSHRSFAMGMEDVARAYRIAHAADRVGVFSLSAEFDAMRARMEHLRNHPDLAHLEPELLQLAAQMSQETRDLARTYSDDKVARARLFLEQRQQEVQALTDRLSIARRTCDELRRWLTDIEADERQAQLQLRRLEADLKEILPGLGYDFDHDELRDANVVALPKPAK
jgi:membrane protein implicated in regulation of membrane protease activity